MHFLTKGGGLKDIVLGGVFFLSLFALFPGVSNSKTIDNNELDDLFGMSFNDLMQIEIVSSDKKSTPIEEIPASVSIITRTEIKKSGYLTLTEIIQNIPGMYLQNNTESLFIGIRGAAGGGVQFLVNGIPQHPSLQKGLQSTDISQFNIPVETIDRIEVIRGPMSVIYGNNAFLGLVNIVTNDIDRQKSLLGLTYGTRNTAQVTARYGVKFDQGYLVVNGGTYQTDGLDCQYKDMLSASQLAELDPNVKTSMDGDFNQQNGNIDLYTQYKEFSANLRYSKMEYGIYPNSVGFGGHNRINMETYQASVAYEKKVTDHTRIKGLAVYSNEEYHIPSLSIYTPETNGYQKQNSRRSEIEANVVQEWEKFQIVNGYRFRLMDDLYNAFFLILDPNAGIASDTKRNVDDIVTHEVFSQATYMFFPKWQFVAGLRYMRLPQKYKYLDESISTTAFEEHFTDIKDRDLFTGRAALLWNMNSHNILRLLAGSAAQDRDQIEISRPEYITTWEMNWSTTYANFQSSISLFHNDIEQIVQRSLVMDVDENIYANKIDNSGKWKTTGVEVMSEFRFHKNWRANGSLTLQKTQDHVNDIVVGYSPHFLAKMKMYYKNGPLSLALNAYYVDEMKAGYQLTDDDNNTDTPMIIERMGQDVNGYFVLGANVRYELQCGVFVAFRGNNLLDSEIRYPANELTEMDKGLIGLGRMFYASIGFNLHQ